MSKALVSREYARDLLKGSIPPVFCWTKMGTEAGQGLSAILHRKELERLAGNGVFAWGIGNSLGAAPALARQLVGDEGVDVLFTPMKSAAKQADVAPSQILLWLSYHSPEGPLKDLPLHVMVTSRGSPDKRAHYALLCHSATAIDEQATTITFDASDVRNLVSDNPVGASQVTSVVRYYGAPDESAKTYRVALRAKLHAEGFIRLANPVILRGELHALYRDICETNSASSWRTGVARLKTLASRQVRVQPSRQTMLEM